MSHAALKQGAQPEQPVATGSRSQVNDLPVGEILRRARVHYEHSIPDIERVLRIPAAQLEAIEGGHYDLLPGRVYAIGFVRSYSQYLGLDSEHIVALFKDQSANSAVVPDLHFPVSAEQSSLPSKWIVLGTIAALILLPILWSQLKSTEETGSAKIPLITEEITQSVSDNMVGNTAEIPADVNKPQTQQATEINETELSADPTDPQAAEAFAPIQTPESQRIILTIIENSWVEIRDSSGKRLVSRVLKAGDQYFVPNHPGLKMSIGNAGGVELSLDGNTLPPLGKPGSVVRNISLDIAALKKLEKEH